MTADLDALLARARSAAEELMTDTVRIERHGEQVLDRTTGHLQEGPRTVLYDGMGRVKPQAADTREVTAGDRNVVRHRYTVTIPWSTVPASPVLPGDPITVTASKDARLHGKALVVSGVTYSATATAWRITGEDQT